jgi:putative hydrolase of the HAD superfamily
VEGEFGLGKPDQAVFRHALAALGCRPDEAWMIGDSLTFDIAPAVALGMYAIWVNRSGATQPPDSPYEPSRIVAALSDILKPS